MSVGKYIGTEVATRLFSEDIGTDLVEGRTKARDVEYHVLGPMLRERVDPELNQAVDQYGGNGARRGWRDDVYSGDPDAAKSLFADVNSRPHEEVIVLSQIWPRVAEVAGDVRRKHYEHIVRERHGLPDNWNLDVLDNPYEINVGGGPGLTQIEHYIGGIQIPVGYAGPLLINGEHAKGEFYPLGATHEARLFTAMQSGAKFVSDAAVGGAETMVTNDGMARSALFRTHSFKATKQVMQYIDEHLDDIRSIFTQREPEFLKLIDIQPYAVGTRLYIRFVADTGNAMGMNMVTQGTDDVAKYLAGNLPDDIARYETVSGNMCMDKKAGAIDVILGRGKTVDVGFTLPERYLAHVLREPNVGQAIDEFNNLVTGKLFVGSAKAGGGPGSQNSNVGNIIAAAYAITGQDLAQTVESSAAITSPSIIRTANGERAYRYEIHFPSFEIATVGGGTGNVVARKALEAIGCGDPKDPAASKRLAEIFGAFATASEFSTLTSMYRDRLADSHTEGTKTYADTDSKQ